MPSACIHLAQLRQGSPVPSKSSRTHGCEECLKLHQQWVHLRECLTCGHVGCCDSSVGKHATKHFHQVHHPVMRSIEPGEAWLWCYVDEVMLELPA